MYVVLFQRFVMPPEHMSFNTRFLAERVKTYSSLFGSGITFSSHLITDKGIITLLKWCGL
jgi:hypothetical protein